MLRATYIVGFHRLVFRVGNVFVPRFGGATPECGGCVIMGGLIQNVQLSNRRAKLWVRQP